MYGCRIPQKRTHITRRMSSAASFETSNYNQELKASISRLQSKREALQRQIGKEEEEASSLQQDMDGLAHRLKTINDGIAKKKGTRDEYDRTISEVTKAYGKIVESSQTLLHVLKRETKSLNKKERASSTPGKNGGDFE